MWLLAAAVASLAIVVLALVRSSSQPERYFKHERPPAYSDFA